MDYNISFQELAKLQAEVLAKQEPVTLEEARAQCIWLNKNISKEEALEIANRFKGRPDSEYRDWWNGKV